MEKNPSQSGEGLRRLRNASLIGFVALEAAVVVFAPATLGIQEAAGVLLLSGIGVEVARQAVKGPRTA